VTIKAKLSDSFMEKETKTMGVAVVTPSGGVYGNPMF
jgi:hypothetical protein